MLTVAVGQPKNAFFPQPPPVIRRLKPVMASNGKTIVWRGDIASPGTFASAEIAAMALDELIRYYEQPETTAGSQEGPSSSCPSRVQLNRATSETTTDASAPTLIAQSNGSSQAKIEANRRNAKKSTGPKTAAGRTISSWNSTRHGLLSKHLPSIWGKDKKHFARL